jgi:DHA2 family multidrug resistance protein
MSWIQTAYLIAEVIAIPLTGFLTRALSMRWLFVIAVSVFTLASIGCASSNTFPTLIVWRIVQGFSGGTLIPAVFAAVFLLFPPRLEAFATTIAGVLAVLAPTVGPIVGGWITHAFSWHWLFLINVIPGIVSAVTVGMLLPRGIISRQEIRTVDIAGLALLALALSALEIALKEAPGRGWASALVLGLCAVSAVSALAFAFRTLKRANPIVDLKPLRDRRFAIACLLSFVLGIGLFGSVYVMPVFLAVVRGHNALEIGAIMLVTGIAQLLTAPVAVFLEKRLDARLLAAFGFALFAVGLAMSTRETSQTDFSEMFWPQIVRGVAIMFCLLPPTRLALGHLPLEKIPNASGLFNLMRNLGGAIGIALIDTIVFARAPDHARSIASQLASGNLATAREGGFPAQVLIAMHGANPTPELGAYMAQLVQKLAMARALNDAWALMAVVTVAALAALVVLKPSRKRSVAELVDQ